MELAKKITFITGFEKNCGKTTFLNYLLSKNDSSKKIMCATVGIDQESKDFLDDNYKPKVLIKKNWKALTNTAFLKSFNFSYKINNVFDFEIIGAKPVIIIPEYDSYLKLASPGPHLVKILEAEKFNIDRIYIDGAFDRITQISQFYDCEFYYVFKLTNSNIDIVCEKIKLLSSFMDVKIRREKFDFLNNMENDFQILNDTLYLKGALTYSKVQTFPKNVKEIILLDFTKIFMGYNDWISFSQNYNVFFASSFKFCGYVINLYDINIKDFEKRFDKKIITKFVYNPYEYRKIL